MTNLTLVPTAGLCNRINAILCAIAISKVTDLNTQIYWEKSSECYADFSDLFQPIQGFPVHKLTSFVLKPGNAKNLFLPSILRKLMLKKCHNGEKTTFVDILPMLREQENIYINSSNRFSVQDITKSVGEIFRPIDILEEKINNIVSEFSDETIGIHIRRTDNVQSISESPIERFEQFIEEEIAKNPNCKFYLATDDIEIKQLFKQKYPNNIIAKENELKRNSVKGMQDAVIDLYCLAKTTMILGSSHSTYSLMASWLYNTPLTICR